MVELDKVEEEILCLEKKDTTYAVVERLAWLYTVRDHLRDAAKKAEPSAATPISSEFLQAIDGKHPDDVWQLVDELVESVKITQPRLYESYMRKFNELEKPGRP